MKSPIDQLALQFQINYLRIMSEIEQPENCKAFIPMHRTVYLRDLEINHRIVEGWFLLASKESTKNLN